MAELAVNSSLSEDEQCDSRWKEDRIWSHIVTIVEGTLSIS